MIFAAVFDIASRWISTVIIIMVSDIITAWNAQAFVYLCCLLCADIASFSFGSWLRDYSFRYIFTTAMSRYMHKVLYADYTMFTKYSVSYINTASQFINGIASVGNLVERMVVNIASVAITIWGMAYVDAGIVIPVLVIYGIGMLMFKFIFKKYGAIEERRKEAMQNRAQELENVINGFTVVRSFNTQDMHAKSLDEQNDIAFTEGRKKSVLNMKLNAAILSFSNGGVLAVILFVLRQIALGLIAPSSAMSLIMFVNTLSDPLVGILDFAYAISENLSLEKDYKAVMEYRNRLSNDGSMNIKSFEDSIEIKNVSFSYDEVNDTIKNINMVIPKGSKIAIVGVSGTGKSTLFKLLMKFHQVQDGEILIDGVNINSISNASYFARVSAVHQENEVYPTTIRENIMYGNPKATDEEFLDACKRSRVYDFAMQLEDRFDTDVGPHGVKLSGGQIQRIALARLLIHNPDIVLLDEATSALDNISEREVQKDLDALDGKTIITIAHRLSTVRNSDYIYVLGKDGIIEEGTPEELELKRGAYYTMLEATRSPED